MGKAYIVARVDDNGIVIIHPMDDSPIWETIHPITGERNRVDITEGHVVDVRVTGIAIPPEDKESPMTDLEHELRMETKALTDGGDPLAGYRLVAFDRDGGSSWFNAALGKHLYRDPDGSVVDPRSLRSVNYAKDMVDTKRHIEGEER